MPESNEPSTAVTECASLPLFDHVTQVPGSTLRIAGA